MTTPEIDMPVRPSLAVASFEEQVQLDEKLARERAWYADTPSYQDVADIEAAVENGELVEFHNSPDARRIGSFEAGLPGYHPYLSPRAMLALGEFTALWREVLLDFDMLAYRERLAITSMTRTQAYQDGLVADPRKLASPDSTHCKGGNAWDVDNSGYYFEGLDGTVYSVTDPRRHAAQARISNQLRRRHGELAQEARVGAMPYDARICRAANIAAKIMHKEGSINLIEEFKGTENACLHIAVSPAYPQ